MPRTAWWSKGRPDHQFLLHRDHSTHDALRVNGHRTATLGGELPGYRRGAIHLGAYSFVGPHSLIWSRAAAWARAPSSVPMASCVARGAGLRHHGWPTRAKWATRASVTPA